MSSPIDHDQIEAALRGCGSGWTAAQAHGLLCSRLAVAGVDGGSDWLGLLLQESAVGVDCDTLLFEDVVTETYRQLAERQSDFEPALPSDDEPTDTIVTALAGWSEGFLHGLVSDVQSAELKEKLAAEPLSDIIKDLLEITRAGIDADEDPEETERALTELIEYLRVAAQLVYEELADVRNVAAYRAEAQGDADVLH